MNTPQTMFLGWGSLIVAAGVSFYYAKKSINERRAMQEAMGQRPSAKLDWRTRIEQQEKQASASANTPPVGSSTGVDGQPPGKGAS